MLVKQKPVTVEAHQWYENGDHPNDKIGQWVHTSSNWHDGYTRKEGAVVQYYSREDPSHNASAKHMLCGRMWSQHGWVDNSSGGQIVCPGDWIITDSRGEYHSCKPDIFAENYEEVQNG